MVGVAHPGQRQVTRPAAAGMDPGSRTGSGGRTGQRR
jgi:hypothetical protein